MPSAIRRTIACGAFLVGAICCSSCTAAPAPPAPDSLVGISARALLADITALAADSMEGRFPGTAGDRRARAYLIRRLKEIGFEPGGENGSWEQPITFIGLTVKNFDSWRFSGPGGGQVQWLILPEVGTDLLARLEALR